VFNANGMGIPFLSLVLGYDIVKRRVPRLDMPSKFRGKLFDGLA
jgi:hypothetical protein